jgi:hypothetical protein
MRTIWKRRPCLTGCACIALLATACEVPTEAVAGSRVEATGAVGGAWVQYCVGSSEDRFDAVITPSIAHLRRLVGKCFDVACIAEGTGSVTAKWTDYPPNGDPNGDPAQQTTEFLLTCHDQGGGG